MLLMFVMAILYMFKIREPIRYKKEGMQVFLYCCAGMVIIFPFARIIGIQLTIAAKGNIYGACVSYDYTTRRINATPWSLSCLSTIDFILIVTSSACPLAAVVFLINSKINCKVKDLSNQYISANTFEDRLHVFEMLREFPHRTDLLKQLMSNKGSKIFTQVIPDALQCPLVPPHDDQTVKLKEFHQGYAYCMRLVRIRKNQLLEKLKKWLPFLPKSWKKKLKRKDPYHPVTSLKYESARVIKKLVNIEDSQDIKVGRVEIIKQFLKVEKNYDTSVPSGLISSIENGLQGDNSRGTTSFEKDASDTIYPKIKYSTKANYQLANEATQALLNIFLNGSDALREYSKFIDLIKQLESVFRAHYLERILKQNQTKDEKREFKAEDMNILIKYSFIIDQITKDYSENIDVINAVSYCIAVLTGFIIEYHNDTISLADSSKSHCDDSMPQLIDTTLAALKRAAENGNDQINTDEPLKHLDKILKILVDRERTDKSMISQSSIVMNSQVCTCLKILKILSKHKANLLVNLPFTFGYICDATKQIYNKNCIQNKKSMLFEGTKRRSLLLQEEGQPLLQRNNSIVDNVTSKYNTFKRKYSIQQNNLWGKIYRHGLIRYEHT